MSPFFHCNVRHNSFFIGASQNTVHPCIKAIFAAKMVQPLRLGNIRHREKKTPGTFEVPGVWVFGDAWCFSRYCERNDSFIVECLTASLQTWRLCVRRLSLRTPCHCERNDSFIVKRLTASLQTWRLWVRRLSLRTRRHCERMNAFIVERLTASLQTC